MSASVHRISCLHDASVKMEYEKKGIGNELQSNQEGGCDVSLSGKRRDIGILWIGDAMRPIFTIYAGEYLVADYIERHYGKSHGVRVWVPSKDDGIDLLVTDQWCRKSVSLQVKYSKSYDCESAFDATGWWKLKREKVEASKADYWVFVVPEFCGKRKVSSCYFVILTPKELIKRLKNIHGDENPYNVYLTSTRQ